MSYWWEKKVVFLQIGSWEGYFLEKPFDTSTEDGDASSRNYEHLPNEIYDDWIGFLWKSRVELHDLDKNYTSFIDDYYFLLADAL